MHKILGSERSPEDVLHVQVNVESVNEESWITWLQSQWALKVLQRTTRTLGIFLKTDSKTPLLVELATGQVTGRYNMLSFL